MEQIINTISNEIEKNRYFLQKISYADPDFVPTLVYVYVLGEYLNTIKEKQDNEDQLSLLEDIIKKEQSYLNKNKINREIKQTIQQAVSFLKRTVEQNHSNHAAQGEK